MIAARKGQSAGAPRWTRLGVWCLPLLALALGPVRAQENLNAAPGPEVTVSVAPLDLATAPSDDDLSAAGQLGGALYPVMPPDDQTTGAVAAVATLQAAVTATDADDRRAAGNLAFGRAMQRWNAHAWKDATAEFQAHLTQFPDSPWRDEAELHLACEARYQGRYTQAQERYTRILARTANRTDAGARRLANKARMRLAEAGTLRNNLDAAGKYFSDLRQNAVDWRDRTYASHWLQRIGVQRGQERAFLNCGYLALGELLAKRGEQTGAQALRARQASGTAGQSLQELKDLAGEYGLQLQGRRLDVGELDQVPLPAIVQIPGPAEGDKGHFWILEDQRGEVLRLHDPQSGRWFRQTLQEFSGEWQGVALVFADGEISTSPSATSGNSTTAPTWSLIRAIPSPSSCPTGGATSTPATPRATIRRRPISITA